MAQSPDSGKRGKASGRRGGGRIDFTLDRQSDVSLGTQLAWKLRGAVASGRLAPGERLPPVRELAGAAGVNVNTVRAVYGRLAEQGLIVSEHGRGTFVAETLADSAELRDLAARTAEDAARHGVDPRELAAVLYSSTPGASRGGASGPGARRTLRTRIAALERELAELDQELVLLDETPPAPPPAPEPRRAGGARILELGELEAVHESLAMQVAERRVELELARERGHAGAEPRAAAPSVATKPPELVVGAGTWTLRWRV